MSSFWQFFDIHWQFSGGSGGNCDCKLFDNFLTINVLIVVLCYAGCGCWYCCMVVVADFVMVLVFVSGVVMINVGIVPLAFVGANVWVIKINDMVVGCWFCCDGHIRSV